MAQDPNVPADNVITPIAFWKTRSFWLGWFPAILTLLDQLMQLAGTEAAVPVANSLAAILSIFGSDISGIDIANFMLTVAPVYALIVAHQRRGFNRPYEVREKPETDKIAVVVGSVSKEGAAAYQQGRAIGDAIKGITRK